MSKNNQSKNIEQKKNESPAERRQTNGAADPRKTTGEIDGVMSPEWIALCASCGNEVPDKEVKDAVTCTAEVPCSDRIGKAECRQYTEKNNGDARISDAEKGLGEDGFADAADLCHEQDKTRSSTPLAVHPPDLSDRVAALEKANIELEKRLEEHERYHFGERK